MKFYSLLIFLLFAKENLVFAYPEFISYGYSSCLTCHFNGLGGGPLNDYGRALWSAEIAGRLIYNTQTDDETIANQSGFLGSAPIPNWLRPHLSYRGLELRQNPYGSHDNSRWLTMQEDFGVTLQNQNASDLMLSATWGRVILPAQYSLGSQKFTNVLAEEYFIRKEVSPGWWLYAGLLEKVFGIRNANHESFQRKYQGFQIYNNNADGVSTSEGIILQRVIEKSDLAFNIFLGNPYDSSTYREKGLSTMGETEVGENQRLGASALISENQLKSKNMLALHYRAQINKGSSLIFEYGLIRDKPAGATISTGSYQILSGTILLTRGYNFIFSSERYNQNFNQSTTDSWKSSAGFVLFPLARMELRTEITNSQELSNLEATPDTWSTQVQIHVSL